MIQFLMNSNSGGKHRGQWWSEGGIQSIQSVSGRPICFLSFSLQCWYFRVLAVQTWCGAPAARPTLLSGSVLLAERGQRVVRQVPGAGSQPQAPHRGSLSRHLQSTGSVRQTVFPCQNTEILIIPCRTFLKHGGVRSRFPVPSRVKNEPSETFKMSNLVNKFKVSLYFRFKPK